MFLKFHVLFLIPKLSISIHIRMLLLEVEMAVGLPEGPSYPGYSPRTNHFFAVLLPERLQKGRTQLLSNRLPVFSLLLPFSWPSSSFHFSFSPDVHKHSF